MLAQISLHPGGFERLDHIVRVEGHVSCADGFYDPPVVLVVIAQMRPQ